ncbi:MAG: Mini-ribonuclease 3 [Clostridia bacterium]|nr:Mini-ribonuclease 3 [Clostridia bacterium]
MKINDICPNGTSVAAREYSPLTLALIGDGVYELYVRSVIVGRANAPAGKIHKECVKYVKAKAQADAAKLMLENLSEEELWIFKRGRNAKAPTVPKNADVTDYRLATGFEALIGYLYLEGREERITELCKIAVESVENNM